MTPTGRLRLQALLKRLKTTELPTAIKALEVARGHGDLSENAEYDAAKERHEQLLVQIKEVEEKLIHAQVIDPATLDHDKVVFGATVQLRGVDNGEEVTYQLVGSDESNISEGKLSVESPIGRALIGKEEGDVVRVQTPRGAREFALLKIRYI